ncbi:MAG: hypothetical protein ACI9UJ_001925, partial [bacterium]
MNKQKKKLHLLNGTKPAKPQNTLVISTLNKKSGNCRF